MVTRRANRKSTARTGNKWTPEADKRLIQARTADIGWDYIAKNYFVGVTGNACRKRYERLMDALRSEEWNGPRHAELMLMYSRQRELLWTGFAKVLSGSSGRPVRWMTLEKQILGPGYKSTMRAVRAAERRGHSDDTTSEDEAESAEHVMTPSTSPSPSSLTPETSLLISAPLTVVPNAEQKQISAGDIDRSTQAGNRRSGMPISLMLAPETEGSQIRPRL